MESVFRVLDRALDTCRTFGPAEWAVISIIAVVVGYMLLRGTVIR
jgi:hypothetical protein